MGVMKTCRTALTQKQELRTRESVTKEEIEMLEKNNMGLNMGPGWTYSGSFYINVNAEIIYVFILVK